MFKTKNLLKIVYVLFLTIVTFFYIYQVSFAFLGIPFVWHSRRIAAVILVFLALFSFREKVPVVSFLGREYRKYVRLTIFLFLFSFLQLLLIGKDSGVHMFDTMLNIVLFGIPVYWAHKHIYSSLDNFMHVLLYITLIQTVIIFVCLFNPTFATLMDFTFNYLEDGGLKMESLRSRYAGGIGCIAAPGAILYSLGLLASSYLFVSRKRWYYLLVLCIFMFVSTMIARTGLVIDIVCVLYVLKQSNAIIKKIGSVALVAIGMLSILFVISANSNNSFWEERFFRYESLADNGFRGDFFDGYIDGETTSYPDLSLNTFFGTGMMSGKSGIGDVVNVDGGPLRVYSAIGLLLTIVVYWKFIRIFFSTSKSLYKRNHQLLLFVFTVLILLGDFKEPTLLSVWPMTLFFTTAYLSGVEFNNLNRGLVRDKLSPQKLRILTNIINN